MANYGAVIQKLRKEKGYTQSALGKMLNVSAQAVSKWEKNSSQPDLDTIQNLTAVLGISVTEFMRLSNVDELPLQVLTPDKNPTPLSEETAVTNASATYIKENNFEDKTELKNDYKLNDNHTEEILHPVQGRRMRRFKPKEIQSKNKLDGWLLFGLIAGIVLGIACMVYLLCIKQKVYIAILSGYGLFALISSIGHDCYGDDVFFWAWHKSIDIPGVIFSLDIDGIIFLLTYKIIIAPLLTLFLFLLFGILGTIAAVFVSAITYPFFIPRMIRETFKGEL